MESSVKKFTDVFDENLSSVLFQFLGFDEVVNGLMRLNKYNSRFLKPDSYDFIWKFLFSYEFLNPSYEDHKKNAEESYYSYFKRSFLVYQEFRRTWATVIRLTNEQNTTK